MKKKLFDRFEIREQNEKQSCLLSNSFFRKEPKEIDENNCLKLKGNPDLELLNESFPLDIPNPNEKIRLVFFFTVPQKVHQYPKMETWLYKVRVAYLKTRKDQKIFDYVSHEVTNTLNEHQGILEYLDLFFLPLDSYLRIAVEYQYGTIKIPVLRRIVKQITSTFFLLENINNERLECTLSYTQDEFKTIFNSSKRSKRVIFYSDTVNTDGQEFLNSIKHEFSLVSTTQLDQLKHFIKDMFTTHNAIRYVLKCEDDELKTTSFEGNMENMENMESWSRPARIQIQENDYPSLLNFLKMDN